jgi:hypothetical protein
MEAANLVLARVLRRLPVFRHEVMRETGEDPWNRPLMHPRRD